MTWVFERLTAPPREPHRPSSGLGARAALLPALLLCPSLSLLSTRASAANLPDVRVDLEVAPTRNTVEVPVAARFADVLVFRIGTPKLTVKLYPADTLLSETDKVCEVQSGDDGSVTILRRGPKTSPACQAVLANETTAYTLAIPTPGGLRLVSLNPTLKDMLSRSHEVTTIDGLRAYLLAEPVSPSSRFFYNAGTIAAPRWQGDELVDGKFPPSSEHGAILSAGLEQRKKAELYVYLPRTGQTIFHTISLKPPDPPKTAKVNVPNEIEIEAIENGKLVSACGKIAEINIRTDYPHYQVCIDMTTPTIPRVVVLEVKKTKKKVVATPHSGPLVAGRPIYARVYHAPGTKAELTIEGDDSFPTMVFIHPTLLDSDAGKGAATSLAPGEVPKTVLFYDTYALSRAGNKIVFTAAVNRINPPAAGSQLETYTLVRQYSHSFRNIPSYRGAVRLGVALAWAPWDAKYGLRASDTPQNPGKEIYRVEGGPPRGRLGAEFVLGYSFYIAPKIGNLIPADRTKPWFSWYAGLGLLGVREAKSEFFTSIHTGPELSINHNWSIVLSASLRRTSRLHEDHRIGDVLPTSTTEAPLTAWPTVQFGIIVNFSPQALQITANARKRATSP